MISMFITSLWTSDRASEFCAVRRRTHVGSPYQVSIIPHFLPVVNTFLKNCTHRLFKILPCYTKKYATMYKIYVSSPVPQETEYGKENPPLPASPFPSPHRRRAYCTTPAQTFSYRLSNFFSKNA